MAALEDKEVVEETRELARVSRERTVAALRAEAVPYLDVVTPDGGAYLFLNLKHILDGRDCFDLLDDALNDGVCFAPGIGFGRAYSNWARLCFTSMEPAQAERGVAAFGSVLRRWACPLRLRSAP